ncbi:glycogen debranching protein [uncultured Dokdonia sp.]|uniref:alpha-L-rhamnosidase-related protein n=1 Tax=uncultured Dokdonia sp. TaxID=575653 RepID=UPI0026180782|nr:glycogen debranching protein [uncultured Dokdonia sp.]
MLRPIIVLFSICFLISCTQTTSDSETLSTLTTESPFIKGTPNYLPSPFVTAGDRVYMVGHQDGTFPELGWHIKGEMGGIWDHPIKLMDGFEVSIVKSSDTLKLDNAHTFVNYPYANMHTYSLPDQQLAIERWQFVPDHKEGIFIQFQIKNTSSTTNDFKLSFVGHADLRPTWLGEETNMIDSQDSATYNALQDHWMMKDTDNPWFVSFGSDMKSTARGEETTTYAGKGISGRLQYDISIPKESTVTINFVIAGSYTSQEEALATYQNIHSSYLDDVRSKKQRYEQLASRSQLTIPDKDIQQTFEWLKYNSDWLVRTIPEIGSGITAGIPDYPWWFGVDSEYALKGYMAIGQTDPVYNTIKLLDSVSNALNGNGRIIHEMSTNGEVFNPGNINETPQFASLIWEVYQWNGDQAFLEKYFPTIEKGLQWLLEEKDDNKNLFPDGFGMMEIHGLDSEMIDVAAYTQRAFDDASKMATILGKEKLSKQYREIALSLKAKINTDFWSEEFKSYADFIGTDQQAIHLIEDAIVRADTLKKPWAVTELQSTLKTIKANPSAQPRPFVVHHNWVVNTPMEMGIADSTKALQALQTAENFVNPFGVFVTGIDRDDSAGKDDGSFKGSKIFSYTGAVMTLPTGVQVIAENNYGHPDKALNYLKRVDRTFSYALPGSMYEVSPDYGMITQAWNIYSYAIPIVQQFFGVQPNAAAKKVTIRPQMPSTWNQASLENILIGDNEVSIYYTKTDTLLDLTIKQTNPEWEITVEVPIEDGSYQTTTSKDSTLNVRVAYTKN